MRRLAGGRGVSWTMKARDLTGTAKLKRVTQVSLSAARFSHFNIAFPAFVCWPLPQRQAFADAAARSWQLLLLLHHSAR